MLGNLLGQTGLEKPRLHSQGVHACWLAHQSGQRDLRVAELPNPKGQTLWLHPLHTTAQHYIWGRKRRLGEDPIEAAQISGDKAAPAATTTSSPVTAQHSPALDLG